MVTSGMFRQLSIYQHGRPGARLPDYFDVGHPLCKILCKNDGMATIGNIVSVKVYLYEQLTRPDNRH